DALGLASAALPGDLTLEVILGHVREPRLVLDTLDLAPLALLVLVSPRLGRWVDAPRDEHVPLASQGSRLVNAHDTVFADGARRRVLGGGEARMQHECLASGREPEDQAGHLAIAQFGAALARRVRFQRLDAGVGEIHAHYELSCGRPSPCSTMMS